MGILTKALRIAHGLDLYRRHRDETERRRRAYLAELEAKVVSLEAEVADWRTGSGVEAREGDLARARVAELEAQWAQAQASGLLGYWRAQLADALGWSPETPMDDMVAAVRTLRCEGALADAQDAVTEAEDQANDLSTALLEARRERDEVIRLGRETAAERDRLQVDLAAARAELKGIVLPEVVLDYTWWEGWAYSEEIHNDDGFKLSQTAYQGLVSFCDLLNVIAPDGLRAPE